MDVGNPEVLNPCRCNFRVARHSSSIRGKCPWGPGLSNTGVRARSGGRTSPPPSRLVSSTLGASLSQYGGITPLLNRLLCGEALLQKRPEHLMRDCACHNAHRQAGATHEGLEARVGANWVPLR